MVEISKVKGSINEYSIKDTQGFLVGNIKMLELNKESKFALFRINIYKKNENESKYLKEALEIMLKSLFVKSKLNKVNVLIREDQDLMQLSNSGFNLEGICPDNAIEDDIAMYELMFGITAYEYGNNSIRAPFTIRGERVDLKILTPDKAKELLEYSIDNKNHLEPFEAEREEGYYTEEHQRKYLIEQYKKYMNGSGYCFGIYIDNKLIGKITIANIVLGVFKNGTIGYSIAEKYQGYGYMTEAVEVLADYAFDELNIHRLEASALIDNIKSQRVLEKVGFEKLGINKNYLYINGEWQDHVTYYMTTEIY